MVIVPAISDQCVAQLVLLADGTPHEVHLVNGNDTDYAALIADVWARGEGFVIVEHDIAPWWGAIDHLRQCPKDWCMFEYAKYGGGVTHGLGCVKFSDRLVKNYPDLSKIWINTDWRLLDGAVGSAIVSVIHSEPCFHAPPVAHARGNE